MEPKEIAEQLRTIIGAAESAITLVEPASVTGTPDVERARPYVSRIWVAAETILQALNA